MASTQAQNCQRGTIFLCFMLMVFFLIVVIIKMIKKLFDTAEVESGKYKEEDGAPAKKEEKPKGEDSTLNFD
jgi:hypothetical protein